MKEKKRQSLYQVLAEEIKERSQRNLMSETLDLPSAVRRLRQENKLTGVALCRKAGGGLDPRTLTALEKGRIKNPSIKTLQAVARGLGISVSELFRQTEIRIDRHFFLGSQKGAYQIDFPSWGIKIVSFTPLLKDFFCGKLIFSAHKKLDQTMLKHPLPIFVSTLFGRLEASFEGKTLSLKEGDNIFFNGVLRHSFYNPLERESVLLIMTAPSFL